MTLLLDTEPLLFEHGDRMSREEFIDRWERMPELKNAELIDNVVYMPWPVSLAHGTSHGLFSTLLAFYAVKTPGCEFLTSGTWMMLESAPQIDAALIIRPEFGGRTTVRGEFASGAPELAMEVVTSSRSYELGPKLALYQTAGTPEHVAALTEEEQIEWRVLDRSSYRLMPPDPDGVFRSKIFPGLWLDSAAFWAQDGARLLSVLEQGLSSEEHLRFADQLKPL